MSSAVHFHGIDNIVAAFENKGLPFFAVLSGKQIIHKNDKINDPAEAAVELETFLKMLNQGSNAIYTLKIYEEKPPKGIKENTPADYGLNFRLNLPDMLPSSPGRESYMIGRAEQQNEVLSEIKALHARLDKMEEETEEEEEEPQTIGSIFNSTITGMLQNEQVQQMIAGKLVGLLGGPTALAGIGNIPAAGSAETIDQAHDRIDNAIDTLIINTPGGADVLADKLEKLAAMSANDAKQYQFLLNML